MSIKMETTFRQSFLRGTSRCFSDAKKLKGKYDLLILASSWDERCKCITKSELDIAFAIPMFFSVRDSLGLRDKHDQIILDYCASIAGKTIQLKGSSTDVQFMWRELYSNIKMIMKTLRRPLRIIIDISTCPRYYFAATCAIGMKTGLAESITCFYSEASYPPASQPDQEIAFTGGSWKTIAIPGLLGDYDPRKKRFYLVSIGFEGWKTLRVVSRADPERVSVLFPEPGFDPSYPERTFMSNQELFNQYKIPQEQIVKANAGDAIAAWKALNIDMVERPIAENTFYLCSGSKPHSLALVLRAIALGYPSVLYNLPDEHKVVKTEANGRFWKYDIHDLTAFPHKEILES